MATPVKNYFIKPTGTFRWADNSLFGNGTLVISEIRPWLYDGRYTALDLPTGSLSVVAGVITHGANDLYIRAPSTVKFDLHDSDGVVVDTWSGSLTHAGGVTNTVYTDDLATILNAMKRPAPTPAYMRKVVGKFKLFTYYSGVNQYLPDSYVYLYCQSNIYDAANTSILLPSPSLGTSFTIDNTYGDCSGSIWLPGTYRIKIVDQSDSTLVYFDQSGIVINDPATAPATTVTVSVDGAGNVPSGIHAYAVTYVDATGTESFLSARSLNANCAGTKKVDLSDIPTGPTGTTARRIYRTNVVAPDPDTGPYYQVVEIADNVTTTYQDDVSDANLGGSIYPNSVSFDSIIPPFMV